MKGKIAMNDNANLVAGTAAALALLGLTTYDYIRAVRKTRTRRAKTQANKLDALAIKRATKLMEKRVARGDYRESIAQLDADFKMEIEFQQIALRAEV